MGTAETTHNLYHFHYSICSIMVRYALALRGQPVDAEHEIRVEEKQINLWQGEQITEHYLCDINSAGEVPVIAPKDSNKTIPDSVEITKHIAESYPSLIPVSHADEIKSLLSQLHDINFFSLSYAGKPEGPRGAKRFLEKQLEGQISERYREAIKHKIKRIDSKKLKGLEDRAIKTNEESARTLMREIEEMLNDSRSGWCFGLPQPSAIDAHLVVFIARMFDVKRAELIPERLREYADKAMAGAEWQAVMQGRNTYEPT